MNVAMAEPLSKAEKANLTKQLRLTVFTNERICCRFNNSKNHSKSHWVTRIEQQQQNREPQIH
jgi:hypothetical protein